MILKQNLNPLLQDYKNCHLEVRRIERRERLAKLVTLLTGVSIFIAGVLVVQAALAVF